MTEHAPSLPDSQSRMPPLFWTKVAPLPVWYCLAVIAGCLLLKEFYPFSSFPMYSKNAPGAFCLYVTDSNDKVLFTLPEFGKPSSVLKKLFNGKIQEFKADGSIKRYSELTEEQYQVMGSEILKWLINERKRRGRAPLTGNIRLMREEFVLKKGKPVKDTYKLAEIPASNGS